MIQQFEVAKSSGLNSSFHYYDRISVCIDELIDLSDFDLPPQLARILLCNAHTADFGSR
jgi:hypothetical protein